MEVGRKRASWSGQLAFVLAAAASAIGLGNLWRFPYLAAQYGGGTFIVVYLCLVVTLGFTLMLSEIAVGRKTQQSQLTAYSRLHRGWGFIGLPFSTKGEGSRTESLRLSTFHIKLCCACDIRNRRTR